MKISVVIPAYNRGKYLIRCLDSIVRQSLAPFEIIVVDDGSTDDTVEVAKNYHSDLVRVIELEMNCGAQHARNVGIQEAKGDWIAFMDSDDEWLDTKLEQQAKAIERTNCSLCAGGAWVKSPNKEYKWLCEGESGYSYSSVLSLQTYFLFPTILIKRECLLKIGPLDENLPAYQELDLAIRLSKEYQVEYIREPLFVYHIHDNTISKNKEKSIRAREYLFHKYNSEIEKVGGNKAVAAWYRAFAGEYPIGSSFFFKYAIKYFLRLVWIKI